MKLYIQQKVFSWTDRFSVTDASGSPCFYVEGELFSFGKRLHIVNASGAEVAQIRQRVWTWLPTYEVWCGQQKIAEIKKEFTFLRPRYRIAGLDWQVEGSFWEHHYLVSDRAQLPVVAIRKEWMTWGDCYEMDIARREDVIPALAVVLAIDCAMEQAAAASAAT